MPMLTVIRPAQEPDVPYLYRICLLTGDCGKDATPLYEDPFLLGAYYAGPYFFFDKSCCFVAESPTAHTPAGYIVGTTDSARFYEWLNKAWLPKLGIRKKQNESSQQLFSEYPAHLHIDLLPELQHGGNGHRLMQTFLEMLAQRSVKGVHLGVDKNNVNAISFYKREGFSAISEEPWGFLLGRKV